MEENDRRKFLFLVTEKCEAVDPDVRLMAARVLLYLVQGTLTGYSVHKEYIVENTCIHKHV